MNADERKIRKPTDWGPILAQWCDEKDQTHREKRFHWWLKPQLERYFDVRHEASGLTLRNESPRRIDFLCRAKAPLRHAGFPGLIFGIEAKHPLEWDAAGSRLTKWMAQMVEYRHCKFQTKKGEYSIIPAFILSAPPLSDLLDESPQAIWTSRIEHQLGIGELNFRTRSAYDPQVDFRGDDYEVVLEIRFNHASRTWANTHRKMGHHPGDHIFEKEATS